MLWRSACSPSGAIWKSLGPSFGRSRRVLCHSDTHYVLHTTCDYRTYLGVVSCPQKRKEFVHLVFEEAEDYNLFLKTCPGGQFNPGSSAQLCHTACSLSWEYAKFKVVKELELHRVLMVRRTNSCFTAGPAALAMLHALSALDSLDLDTWGDLAARTLMGSAERTTPQQKSVMSTATLASPTSCYGRTSSSRSSASPCVFDL